MSRPAPTSPRTTLLAGLILVCLHLAAHAQRTIRVPADQPTIQAAIDAAATGDTVLVSPGTYYENLGITSKQITLTSSDGPAKTFLDGRGTDAVLTIAYNSNLNTTVSGFTIQNGLGKGSSVAGIGVNDAGATISGNVFRDNTGANPSIPAANISVFSGKVHVLGNIISTRPAAGGAACAGVNGVQILFDGDAGNEGGSFVPSVISGNTIEGDGSRCSGNGILANFADSEQIENNVLRGNLYGMILGGDGAVVRQNLVYNNVSGGIRISHGPETSFGATTGITDSFVVNNTLFNNLNNPIDGSDAEFSVSGPAAKVSFINNLVIGTTGHPALFCPAINPTARDTPLILDHNDLFNTSGGPLVAGLCADPTGTYGNISADPRFTSADRPPPPPRLPGDRRRQQLRAVPVGHRSRKHPPPSGLHRQGLPRRRHGSL